MKIEFHSLTFQFLYKHYIPEIYIILQFAYGHVYAYIKWAVTVHSDGDKFSLILIKGQNSTRPTSIP